MSKYFLLVLFPLFCTLAIGQNRRIRGHITIDGKPMPGVVVMEINKDKRILHQTFSDAKGIYSIPVTKSTNSIRAFAPGYYALTQKIHNYDTLSFCMIPRPVGVDVDALSSRRPCLETSHLFCGHAADKILPQNCRFEQVSDTLFALIIPLRVSSMMDEYPIGRKLIFLDMMDNQLLSTENMMDVVPIVGEPEDIGSKLHVTNDHHLTIRGMEIGAEEVKYIYPRYKISLSQLLKLSDDASAVYRIAMDTPRADNFWILYPASGFQNELQRVMGKFLQ